MCCCGTLLESLGSRRVIQPTTDSCGLESWIMAERLVTCGGCRVAAAGECADGDGDGNSDGARRPTATSGAKQYGHHCHHQRWGRRQPLGQLWCASTHPLYLTLAVWAAAIVIVKIVVHDVTWMVQFKMIVLVQWLRYWQSRSGLGVTGGAFSFSPANSEIASILRDSSAAHTFTLQVLHPAAIPCWRMHRTWKGLRRLQMVRWRLRAPSSSRCSRGSMPCSSSSCPRRSTLHRGQRPVACISQARSAPAIQPGYMHSE